MRISVLLYTFLLGLSSFAQTLKTYSGDYDAPHNDPLIRSGKAIYTYYQGDDKRMYHGKFNYRDKEQIITGNFVNNVQNGQWIYQTSIYKGKCVYSVHFKDGVLNGPFSMTLTNSKTNKIISKIKCNFINGKLGGEASGTNVKLSLIGDLSTIKKNTFKGKFDEEGFPTGDWILSSNSRLWKEIYNGNDTCIVTYINLSTGDKINTSSAPVLPNIIIKEVNSLLKTLLMRDSEQQFLTEFQFDSPRIVQVYSDGKYSYSVTTDNPSSSLFIITYPHHYPSLISPESGTEMPVFQDIPEDALRPSKKPKTSTD